MAAKPNIMGSRIKPPFADECLWSDFEAWADLNNIGLLRHDWCEFWYCWVAALAARRTIRYPDEERGGES